MTNFGAKPMETLIINCAGYEGSNLAENGYYMEWGLWNIVREGVKASVEWANLEHSRTKLHDGWMPWLKQRQSCICKNECRLQPPRQPHTHLRSHCPKFAMNAPVKFQQHYAIYDSANRHRNQCEPDAGERHHQAVDANEQPHHR